MLGHSRLSSLAMSRASSQRCSLSPRCPCQAITHIRSPTSPQCDEKRSDRATGSPPAILGLKCSTSGPPNCQPHLKLVIRDKVPLSSGPCAWPGGSQDARHARGVRQHGCSELQVSRNVRHEAEQLVLAAARQCWLCCRHQSLTAATARAKRPLAVTCRTISLPFRDRPQTWVRPRKSKVVPSVSGWRAPCNLFPERRPRSDIWRSNQILSASAIAPDRARSA